MALRLISPTRLKLRGGGVALTSDVGNVVAPPATGGATALTINEIANLDRKLIQLPVAATSKTIAVSGTYTGTTASVEWRMYNKTTGVAATPWLPLSGATYDNGTYTGNASIVQTMEPLTFQVRDSSNTTVMAECVNRFGIGVHVLCIGQSNMAFLNESVYKYPTGSKSSYTFSTGAFRRLGNINDALPAGLEYGAPGYPGANSETGASRADGIVHLANYLSAALGCMVCVSDYAKPGSDILSWQPNIAGNNFDIAMQAMTAAGGDFETVLWLQGENGPVSNYQASLQGLLAGLQSYTGRGAALNFGVVILGPGTDYNVEGVHGAIRTAELSFLAANSSVAGVFCASSAMDANLAGVSNIHFDPISQARMGKRYAKAVAAKRLGTGDGGSGPKIVSATRSGLTVTVTVQHAKGTLLKDGIGGTGGTLKGFRFFDGGASNIQINYTASSIVNATTVQFTLASTPTGTLTMDYGMANAPFGATTDPATVLYDNDTVPGDTLGLPLLPCPVITVT